jgi:hypothetical protein
MSTFELPVAARMLLTWSLSSLAVVAFDWVVL